MTKLEKREKERIPRKQKKRAKKYEEKLAIDGKSDEVLKVPAKPSKKKS